MQEQDLEGSDEIQVFIIDKTYDHYDEEGPASERFRISLEAEYNLKFKEANIGPSADVPAFLTTLLNSSFQVPIWTVILGLFFSGKLIRDNFDAWHDMAKRIAKFFNHQVVFSRNGASIIAMKAVLDELGTVPKTIQLISYRFDMIFSVEELASLEVSSEINESLNPIFLGQGWHIFEIRLDEVLLRVGINGETAHIVRIKNEASNHFGN